MIDKIGLVSSTSYTGEINTANSFPRDKFFSASIIDVSDKNTTISSGYGIIKTPLIPNLIVNQNISIAVYDVPDRADILKVKIIVPGPFSVDDQIHEFLLRRDINYQPAKTQDIIEVKSDIINQKLYQFSATTSSGQLVNINLELNDTGPEKVFLQNNNIYININDRLYRLIEEVPNLKNFLSLGGRNVSLSIYQEFNLKENIHHFLDILPKSLHIQSLVEVVSVLSQSSQTLTSITTNYLAAYTSVFLPLFSQFKRARLQVRESRSSCKTLRFIFELESEDGVLSIIDCLYLSSANSLNIIVRSDALLSTEFKSKLTTSINHFLSQMQLSGSITFALEATDVLKQILTDRYNNSHDQNYTYTV